ncbi:MAG TPA: MraY family glycosyltransferase [Phycisphaerae bacterium]|nr:MraY family glycosyltransferase [Phycisphaerae bacterium]
MFPPESPGWVDVLHQLWTPGIWVFVVSLLLGLLGTPICRWIALRANICDKPDQAVKIHKAPIPYLGGCAIWFAWTVPVLIYGAVGEDVDWGVLGALVAGGFVAFATGLIDDIKDLSPRLKLLGQAIAGAILLAGGIRWLAFPELPWLPTLHFARDSVFVMGVCLVMHFVVVIGATNATNLLDGLDGLCSGVTVTISVGFLLLATSLTAWANPAWFPGGVTYEHSRLIMMVSFALAGAVIGFLPYNFPPARIFMGDAGSVFIGYALAAMMIMFSSRFGIVKWFVGALFIFGLPIFDTGVAVIRRVVNRRPIMMPDRSHVYNQMVDRLGLSVRTTVGILFAAGMLLAVTGLTVLYIPGRFASLIYLGLGLVVLAVVWHLGFLRMSADERAAADRYLARKRGS